MSGSTIIIVYVPESFSVVPTVGADAVSEACQRGKKSKMEIRRTSFREINAIDCEHIPKCHGQVVGRCWLETGRSESNCRASDGNCDKKIVEHNFFKFKSKLFTSNPHKISQLFHTKWESRIKYRSGRG
jgi:hypothetical protein